MRTDREVSVHDATAALRRYKNFVSKQLTRTHWSSNGPTGDYIERERWIDARRKYLEEVLNTALRRTCFDPPASEELAG